MTVTLEDALMALKYGGAINPNRKIYIIGPEESAKTMARRFGLGDGDYTNITRAQGIPPIDYSTDKVHATHDAWTLPNGEFDRIKICLANMTGDSV